METLTREEYEARAAALVAQLSELQDQDLVHPDLPRLREELRVLDDRGVALGYRVRPPPIIHGPEGYGRPKPFPGIKVAVDPT